MMVTRSWQPGECFSMANQSRRTEAVRGKESFLESFGLQGKQEMSGSQWNHRKFAPKHKLRVERTSLPLSCFSVKVSLRGGSIEGNRANRGRRRYETCCTCFHVSPSLTIDSQL